MYWQVYPMSSDTVIEYLPPILSLAIWPVLTSFLQKIRQSSQRVRLKEIVKEGLLRWYQTLTGLRQYQNQKTGNEIKFSWSAVYALRIKLKRKPAIDAKVVPINHLCVLDVLSNGILKSRIPTDTVFLISNYLTD